MLLKELGEIVTPDFKKQDYSVTILELEALQEKCGEKDLKLDSVVDVSGRTLDFPLIDDEVRLAEEVYMYKNELNLIPKAVGSLRSLKTLKFFSNELNLFPAEFGNLVEMECLQLKVGAPGVNGLELSKLRNLKELDLSRVPPRPSGFKIFSDIAGLKSLTRLSVCHFPIRYLPPEIGCLHNLEYLDISFDKIRKLPDEITSLNLLVSLKAGNNKLIDLPSRLSCLQRLENLDLSNNQLTSLECLELESMHGLRILNLQNNQLIGCHIPSWICCNLEGNAKELSNDESAEMDVYEGAIQETHGPSVSPSSHLTCLSSDGQRLAAGTSVAPSSHLTCLSSNGRRLAARQAEGWKHQYNLQKKARQERLNKCKKLKVDAKVPISSEKCQNFQMIAHRDNNEDLFPAGEVRGNENLITRKESAGGCSSSTIDSDGMHQDFETEGSGSNANMDSFSDAVEVLDEGLSSQTSSCILKSKRQSEKDLDYRKPTKYHRPTNDPPHLSQQYSEMSLCGVADYLPDGFYDGGRDRPFLPLSSYENIPHGDLREVIVLDRNKDEELDAILLRARAILYQFQQISYSLDNLQIATLLALFVSDHFGGSDKSSDTWRTRKAVSGSNDRKPFVCTCATGIIGDSSKATKQGMEPVEDVFFTDICQKSLQYIKERRNSVVVPIGSLQFGICRHRALLMKYLCDRMEPRIPCELVRGYLDFSPHVWNVIVLKKGESLVRMIVDACRPHDIREERDPEYFCRYIPLSRVDVPVVDDHGTGPNCSFPSLTVCDEIGRLASSSLMRCSVGPLEAAVKVRAIKVSEVSADEVRNFEFVFLGEVRMLSVLKHSCIVEFYGHKISSNWPVTSDGNSGGHTIQSAILMEYIEGGSLKCYIEKLSSSGDKHVAPYLALSIARDVAFALTELHSRHIIHRDIKSENVLIDLEKERPDGSPIVKICDFDRAVPLYSYLHTCCIAHVGIPSPDICVGTPLWMAPEVVCAMHKPNVYGLEVDIWSFGCLILELLTLQDPFSELPESEMPEYLQMGERARLTEEMEELARSDDKLDDESETLRFLAKLYHHCTEKNPSNRPSAENVYNMLLDHARSSTVSRSSDQE